MSLRRPGLVVHVEYSGSRGPGRFLLGTFCAGRGARPLFTSPSALAPRSVWHVRRLGRAATCRDSLHLPLCLSSPEWESVLPKAGPAQADLSASGGHWHRKAGALTTCQEPACRAGAVLRQGEDASLLLTPVFTQQVVFRPSHCQEEAIQLVHGAPSSETAALCQGALLLWFPLLVPMVSQGALAGPGLLRGGARAPRLPCSPKPLVWQGYRAAFLCD